MDSGIDVYFLLWLLLPVAAASGWWAALYSQKKRAGSQSRLNSAYGQGIHYLLNEEPDKAAEVLIRMVEVAPHTIELHLALGSLFRRRGEADRAIRIHQNIIACSELGEVLRAQATLELGRDFLRSGLLDRAERLFQNLRSQGLHTVEVCEHLVDLYQQESEWQKAIDVARQLSPVDADTWKPRIAQYFCELAEPLFRKGDLQKACSYLDDAVNEYPNCVRATLLRGSIYQREEDYRSAIMAYRKVEAQEPALLTEVLANIRFCYERLGAEESGNDFLNGLIERHAGLEDTRHTGHPEVTEPGSRQEARYRCEACGFSSRKLFWQCPGCRQWTSVKPIQINH